MEGGENKVLVFTQ